MIRMFKAGIMLLLRPGSSPAQQFAANKQAKYLPSLISPTFKYLIYTKTVYILRIGNHLGRGYCKVRGIFVCLFPSYGSSQGRQRMMLMRTHGCWVQWLTSIWRNSFKDNSCPTWKQVTLSVTYEKTGLTMRLQKSIYNASQIIDAGDDGAEARHVSNVWRCTEAATKTSFM